MASPLPKQLGEFLQEQQEPFTLQLYLLERGHVSSNSNSEPSFLAGSANSCKFLKGINLLPRCSQLVKAVLGKLALVDTNPKIKKIQDSAESDNFSSASSGSTLVNSCSDSDAEDAGQKRISSTLYEKQVVADRKMRANCAEDSKQLSPVSVLEETESSEDDDYDGMSDETNLPSVYSKNMKKARQQTGRTLDSDKLWKLICESIMMWSQDSVDETNINHLLLSDFMASAKEWRGVDEVQGKEIGVMICGLILEDVCCEIVRDMISFGV